MNAVPPYDNIDTAERIVRLETKLDFLISQIEKLPPSPTCVSAHNDLGDRIGVLEGLKNKALGVFIVVNLATAVLVEKMINFVWVQK